MFKRKLLNIIGLLTVLMICTSAAPKIYLEARSEAIDEEYLASFYVRSPDPIRSLGYCGQQIIIEWGLPPFAACQPELRLVLSMITTKHQFERKVMSLNKSYGCYIHRRVGRCLCEKGAVLTYKVEIFSGNRLLKCWKQQGWVEWIDICPED